MPHPAIGDINRPYLIWMVNIQASEQVGIDVFAMKSFAEVGARTEAMNTHFTHIPACPFLVDSHMIISIQSLCHPAVTIFRLLPPQLRTILME